MLKPQFRVHLYKKDTEKDDKWSAEYSDVTDIVDLTENAGIEARKDTFSFNILNRKNRIDYDYVTKVGMKQDGGNRFSFRDNVKIYLWDGEQPINFGDTLVMDGLVNEISQATDEETKNVKISGANRSEILLSNMVPTVVSGSGLTPPEIIRDIIGRVNSFDPSKKLVAALDNETMYGYDNGIKYELSTAGSIQSKHGDGDEFETITYSQNWKNSYEQIEELSGPEFNDPTGSHRTEGRYIMDIVNTPFTTPEGDVLTFNTVRWRNKPTTIIGSLSELDSGSEGFSTSDITLGTFDVINAAIVAGGNNLRGGGVLRVVYNASSMGRMGAKWKFIPLVKTFDTIYNSEKPNITDTDGDRFPDSYPYTFQVVRSMIGSQVANDKEFNDALVNETSIQIKRDGQQIVDLLGDARYKAKFELLKGTNNFILGTLLYLEVPSFGWEGTTQNPPKVLRYVNHSHVFNREGWKTTLFFEEDEKVVSDLVN